MKLFAVIVYLAVYVVVSVTTDCGNTVPETQQIRAINSNDFCNEDVMTVQAAKFAAREIMVLPGPQIWIRTTKCKQEIFKYTLEFRRTSLFKWVVYESCKAVVWYNYVANEFGMLSGSCSI